MTERPYDDEASEETWLRPTMTDAEWAEHKASKGSETARERLRRAMLDMCDVAYNAGRRNLGDGHARIEAIDRALSEIRLANDPGAVAAVAKAAGTTGAAARRALEALDRYLSGKEEG